MRFRRSISARTTAPDAARRAARQLRARFARLWLPGRGVGVLRVLPHIRTAVTAAYFGTTHHHHHRRLERVRLAVPRWVFNLSLSSFTAAAKHGTSGERKPILPMLVTRHVRRHAPRSLEGSRVSSAATSSPTRHVDAGRAAVAVSRTSAGGIPLAPVRTGTIALTTVARRVADARVEQQSTIVRRIVPRCTRVETSAPAAPRVTLRAASGATPSAQPARTPSIVATREDPAPPTVPGVAFAGASLDVLADRVMKQIDRRLVAHRERLGRV